MTNAILLGIFAVLLIIFIIRFIKILKIARQNSKKDKEKSTVDLISKLENELESDPDIKE